MINVSLKYEKFNLLMKNVVDYSLGFLEGIEQGKKMFLKNLAEGTSETLNRYIDANARMNTEALHHVYEWYRAGNPDARLFNITYSIKSGGISFNSTFSQSRSISKDSKEPFYNKARIMEDGSPVVIKPKESSVLVFDNDGEVVFTKKPVTINTPGGKEVRGSFEKTFDSFFRIYFSQAFLRSSGIIEYLENPKAYKNNLLSGSKGGKSVGKSVGYRWIVDAKVGVE